MTRKNSVLLVFAAMISLSACLTPEQLGAVYDGQRPPTQEERNKVAEMMRLTLFDPYSVRDAAISNMVFPRGVTRASNNAMVVCVRFNAKNRFGAYTGLSYTMLKFSEQFVPIGNDDTPLAQSQCADARLGYQPFTELEAI